MNTMRLGIKGGLLSCLLTLAAASTQAEVINLYTEDISAFNDTGRNDIGAGDPGYMGTEAYGVITLTAADNPPLAPMSPFGTGNAIRVVDLTDQDKAELHGALDAPLFEPFRIDFQSFNNSSVDDTRAVRFRMGNNTLNLGSERRAAFSVSWQNDKDVGGKYSGAEDGIGDVDTKNSSPLDPGVHDITMVANAALAGTYTYSIFGEVRTLDPLHYDLYIDGVLLNSSSPGDAKHEDFKNGMQFHFDKSDSEYDPALGLQQFALFTGTSDVGVDTYFDNIILTTGDDIGNAVPEPTTLVALVGFLATAAATRRRG